MQAEVRHLHPFIYSHEKTPAISISPQLENMVRQKGDKTLLIAASTHGLTFGNYRQSLEKSPVGKSRVTADPHIFRDESDGYHAPGGEPDSLSWVPHGVQYLVHPQKWAKGSKLVTWVKLDAKATPKNLMAFVKADGRWTYAASYGEVDLASLRNNNEKAFWFLRTFYRHTLEGLQNEYSWHLQFFSRDLKYARPEMCHTGSFQYQPLQAHRMRY